MTVHSFLSANSVLMLFTAPRIFFLAEWGEKRLRGQVRRARGCSVLRRLLPFLDMASTEFLRGTFPLRNALIFAKWVIVQKWNCKRRKGGILPILWNKRWYREHTRERRGEFLPLATVKMVQGHAHVLLVGVLRHRRCIQVAFHYILAGKSLPWTEVFVPNFYLFAKKVKTLLTKFSWTLFLHRFRTKKV